MPQLPLRPNVCLLIVNKDNRLFLGERNGSPGIWQLPQGGIEEGMSVEESALKEAHEELGVDSNQLEFISQLTAVNQYEFAETPLRFAGQYGGQSQNFCVLRFLGDDRDIKLDRFEQELMNWKWCSVEQAKELAEPKRLAGYLNAMSEFEQWLKSQVQFPAK